MKILILVLLLFITISCDNKEFPQEAEPSCESNTFLYSKNSINLINGIKTYAFPEVCQVNCGMSACSATLIGERTVVTAAHCLKCHESMKKYVTFKDSYIVSVSNYLSHESNDIALVFLEKEVDIIPRAIASTPPIVGDNILLVGFGFTSKDKLVTTSIPRYGCNIIDDVLDNVIHFSATDENSGIICYGDSGGPALINGLLVGIHSHCIDCDVKGNQCGVGTVVDTRVDTHIQWILDNVGDDLVKIK